jgi:hypothetical protein
MNKIFGSGPKTTIEQINEKARVTGPPSIDWRDWTRRLQQALGALLAETVGQREPDPQTWDLVQGAIELEAETTSRVG